MDAQIRLARSLRTDMPKRMMGSETEYTTRINRHLATAVDRNIIAHATSDDELWLRNGGRLYIDTGDLVEFATPECTSGNQVLLHERIGELAVRDLGDVINADSELQRRWPVYKRAGYGMSVTGDDEKTIVAGSKKSTGHHETYQTGLEKSMLADSRPFLEAYLATRIVWSGTGMVTRGGYRLSQKANAMDFKGRLHTAHGEKRALRDKGEGVIEVRTGEGNKSDWAIKQKFDMTSLVFRLMEHRQVPFNDIIRSGFATAAFRGASINPLAPIPRDGHRMDAIDVQLRIAEHAAVFAEKYGAPKDELEAAIEVLKACEDLNAYWMGNDDLSIISDRIDWAAKLDKLRTRGIDIKDAKIDNIKALAHDLSWEDTSKLNASERWYRKRQTATFSEADLRRHAQTPPSARARSRLALIKEHDAEIERIDWSTIHLQDGTTYYVDNAA